MFMFIWVLVVLVHVIGTISLNRLPIKDLQPPTSYEYQDVQESSQ